MEKEETHHFVNIYDLYGIRKGKDMRKSVKQRYIAGILAAILIIMTGGVSYAEEGGETDREEILEEEVSYESMQQSFTLPLKTSEYWFPIRVDKAGSSVDITISSDEENFQAPVSYLFCKGRDINNYIGEVGVANMAGDAIKGTNTSGFHCTEAGEYNIRITNASFINNIAYAGQVNTKPLYVSYKIIPGDEYECNDTKETATVIEPDKLIQFTLNGQNDEDWFVFEVVDGDIPITFGLDNAEKEEGTLWKNFDSPICYWLYLNLGDSLETVVSGAGAYGQGAASSPFTKNVVINSPGRYYLRFANASQINPLYYKRRDNKTPVALTCSFAGEGMEVLYDGNLGEEINDLDLFRDYPDYLHNDLTDRVEGNIQERTNQALDNVYGGEFLSAYKYALDNGGLSIILKEAAAYLGYGKGMDEEFAEESAREYIEALCENENYMKEITEKSLAKVNETRKWLGITGDAITSNMGKNINADFQWMSTGSAKKLLDYMKGDWKTISAILKEGGRVLSFGDIAVSVLTLQDIRLEILESVKAGLPTHSELYKQIEKLRGRMLRDPYQVIVEDFFDKDVLDGVLSEIDDVVCEAIINYHISGGASSVTISLAKIGTKYISKMLPAAKADDTIKAIYKHMYTVSIHDSVIRGLQTEFVQYKVDKNTNIQEKIKEYERMYKIYLLALNEDIQAAKKVADSNGKLLLEGAEYALNNYSYERYIKLCKMAVRQETGGSSGLQYQIVGDKVIVSGNGIPKGRTVPETTSEVIIPAEIQGQTVFKVGDEAFKGNDKIEVVVVEDGVSIIGKEAFAECTNLKQVYLPDSITMIREGAFANCTKLQDIRIGNNVKKIEGNALLNTAVKSLYGFEGTAVQTIAEGANIPFIKEKTSNYIYIEELPNQLNYKADEPINTEGMRLGVQYTDGTSEIVTDGWIAVCEKRGAGAANVEVFCGDARTYFTVELEAVDVTYTIRYVDENGNKIAEDIIKNGKSGEQVNEEAEVVQGYKCENTEISKYLVAGDDNVIEFVYRTLVTGKGDINMDGKITMTDLLMCLHHVSGRTELIGNAFVVADINDDGAVKMTDLLQILYYVSGRDTDL